MVGGSRLGRYRAVVAAACIVAAAIAAPGATAIAQNQRFPDVPPDHYAFEAVEWAAEAGVTLGYGDGTFRPSVPLGRWHAVVFMERYYDEILQASESADFTRGDMMVLLKAINDGTLRGTEAPGDPTPDSTAVAQGQRFPDVPSDHYAFEAVEWAAEAGVTLGYGDGTFRPSVPLGRWHAVVFMERYYDEILQASESADFTRGDMMVLLKAINDGTLRDTDTITDTDTPRDGSAPLQDAWEDSEILRLLESRPDLDHPLNAWAVGSPSHIPSESLDLLTTAGTVSVTVYICGEPGAYSSADLAAATANLNSGVSDFFREQSSGRFDVAFTSGSVLTPSLQWDDLHAYPLTTVSKRQVSEARITGLNAAQAAEPEDVGGNAAYPQRLLLTDFWQYSPNSDRVVTGVAGGDNSFVTVRPAGTSTGCPNSSRCAGHEVDGPDWRTHAHELSHSLLSLPDLYLRDVPTGDPYATDDEVGRGLETYGSLMDYPGGPDTISCFLRRWLGWPVGGQSAPCAGAGASAPLFTEVSFDGDDLELAWLAPLFTGGSHIGIDEYVVSLHEEVYTRDDGRLWEGGRDVSTATLAPTQRRYRFSDLDPESVYVVNVEPRTTHETQAEPLNGFAAGLTINTLPPPTTVNVSVTATEAFLSWPTTSQAWPDGTPSRLYAIHNESHPDYPHAGIVLRSSFERREHFMGPKGIHGDLYCPNCLVPDSASQTDYSSDTGTFNHYDGATHASILLKDLEPRTDYSFRLRLCFEDPGGDLICSLNSKLVSFATKSEDPGDDAGDDSAVTVEVGSVGAVLQWENVDGAARYCVSQSLGAELASDLEGTLENCYHPNLSWQRQKAVNLHFATQPRHRQVERELQPGTTYHYHIGSCVNTRGALNDSITGLLCNRIGTVVFTTLAQPAWSPPSVSVTQTAADSLEFAVALLSGTPGQYQWRIRFADAEGPLNGEDWGESVITGTGVAGPHTPTRPDGAKLLRLPTPDSGGTWPPIMAGTRYALEFRSCDHGLINCGPWSGRLVVATN